MSATAIPAEFQRLTPAQPGRRFVRPPGRRVILVVDDDLDLAASVADIVRTMGDLAQVVVVDSGPAALGILATRPIALIVTDFHMGTMDGLELVGRARILAPGLPCVLMSGDPEAQERLAASPVHGNVAFLHKPFGVHALEQLVAGALAATE